MYLSELTIDSDLFAYLREYTYTGLGKNMFTVVHMENNTIINK